MVHLVIGLRRPIKKDAAGVFPQRHIYRLKLALVDIAGLNSAMQAVLQHKEIEPFDSDAWVALDRAISVRLQEALDALLCLSLALSGETRPPESLRDAMERLAEFRGEKAAKKKLRRAERALLDAPAHGPWDTLHKLCALTSAAIVTKDMDRHVWFEVMAAFRSVNAMPSWAALAGHKWSDRTGGI